MPSYDDELTQIVAELNSSGPGAKPSVSRPPASSSGLDQLVGLAARSSASDILLIPGSAVTLRVHGSLSGATGPPITAEDVRTLSAPALGAAQWKRLETERSLDLSFAREGGRCRANIHYQRGGLAATIRLLPAQIPSIESLHLPAALSRIADRRHGLALVTGPTGCGKSSTLAAFIDWICRNKRCHVVTIEDPIEFQHTSGNSIVQQIEVGSDTPGFAGALRGVLRQTPDVILVGEMRDAETIAAVLTAAETGHLVFSTLHTNDAPQTISRILDVFPAAHQPQIRQQLSLTLAAVVSQQLVPAAAGLGRYPAVEIMMGTDAVRNLIRKGEDHQLLTQISIGRAEGMITMEQSLAELVRGARITRETAAAHCLRFADMQRYLG